ncbi:endonuclease domain-containing protein [Sinimarinibacterium flocculans]|uniref:endonuclease domain-containing protein n=1 Tax=Sinimarinibacterium flocculans TaxID=985250 RepID=UPI0035190003
MHAEENSDNPSPTGGRGAGERVVRPSRRYRTRASHVERAKKLRSNQTDAEQTLWYHLRAHRFFGLKFKRQVPIGGYIVDFACLEHGLVIEVDGGQHLEQAHGDKLRSAFLKKEGFHVLRFWNDEVLKQTEAVLEAIRLHLQLPSPLPPLPQAGEGNRS